MKDVKAYEIIEKKGNTEALIYIHFKVDVISDRDAVYRVKMTQVANEGIYI